MTFLNTFSDKDKILRNVEYIVLDECDKYFEECTFLFYLSVFITDQKLFANLPNISSNLCVILCDDSTPSGVTAENRSAARLFAD